MIDEKKLEEKVEWMKLAFPKFPFMSCRTSRVELFNEFGFYMVTGRYRGQFSDEYRENAKKIWKDMNDDFIEVPHDFSYDPDTKKFIDITGNQFHKDNPQILIMDATDPRMALKYDDLSKNTTHFALEMYVFQSVKAIPLLFRVPRDQKPEGML